MPVALALAVVRLMTALAFSSDRVNDACTVEVAVLHHVLSIMLDNNGIIWLTS